jgi:hypothetical protein
MTSLKTAKPATNGTNPCWPGKAVIRAIRGCLSKTINFHAPGCTRGAWGTALIFFLSFSGKRKALTTYYTKPGEARSCWSSENCERVQDREETAQAVGPLSLKSIQRFRSWTVPSDSSCGRSMAAGPRTTSTRPPGKSQRFAVSLTMGGPLRRTKSAKVER